MEKSILIIGNDRLFIDDLLTVFNGLRCFIKIADTDFKGIKMLINEHFDLVLIDLFFMGFNGRVVANHIRLKRKNVRPIIIGISDNPKLNENNGFDRIFTYPLSTNCIDEVRNYCKNPGTFNVRKMPFLST